MAPRAQQRSTTLYGYAAALTQAGDVVGAERSFRLLAAHLQARFGLTHAVTLRAIAGHAARHYGMLGAMKISCVS